MKRKLFIFVLISLLASLLFYSPFDPDLWWHLRVGQDLASGIFPYHDTYSFSMPGYAWVDHEWLTDLAMYLIYQIGSLPALALVFAAVTYSAFFLAVRTGLLLFYQNGVKEQSKNNAILIQVMILIALAVCRPIIGIRPQMLTLLGLASVNYILCLHYLKINVGAIRLLPVILLAWANLHGGYMIGLGILVLYGIFYIGETLYRSEQGRAARGETRRLLIMIFLSFVACLANPYLLRLFQESLFTSFDPYARAHINEWLTVDFQSAWGAVIFFYLLLVIAAIKRHHTFPFSFSIWQLVLFSYLGFSSRRHVPLLVVASVPILVHAVLVENRSWGAKSSIWGRSLCLRIISGLVVGCFVIVAVYQIGISYRALTDESYLAEQAEYPLTAVRYLQTEEQQFDQLFNYYKWGGYLIWNLPEQPVFIDGRMASWKELDQHILRDYKQISLLQEGWEEKMNQYGIDLVLIPLDLPLTEALRISQDWEQVYQDDLSLIFALSSGRMP